MHHEAETCEALRRHCNVACFFTVNRYTYSIFFFVVDRLMKVYKTILTYVMEVTQHMRTYILINIHIYFTNIHTVSALGVYICTLYLRKYFLKMLKEYGSKAKNVQYIFFYLQNIRLFSPFLKI